VLCCIQFYHAEFTHIYLYYEHAVPLASVCGPTSHDVHKGEELLGQLVI